MRHSQFYELNVTGDTLRDVEISWIPDIATLFSSIANGAARLVLSGDFRLTTSSSLINLFGLRQRVYLGLTGSTTAFCGIACVLQTCVSPRFIISPLTSNYGYILAEAASDSLRSYRYENLRHAVEE
jgi:hypothetical protein